MCQKMPWRKACLLSIEEEGKRHYVINNDFNTFMYDHTPYYERKHFCRYCFKVFITEKILKCHVKDFFEIKVNKWLRCLEKVH